MVAAGAITLANEVLFAPAHQVAAGKSVTPLANVNWRIIPATAGLALGLALLEKIAAPFAVGLAWLLLFASLFTPVGNAPTPLQNINSAFGFGAKVVR